MGETIAMVGQGGKVELIDSRMVKIDGVSSMTPAEAAFLARSLLSCAALIALGATPNIGAVVADLHFPVLKWSVTLQSGTPVPVVIFSVPPGIDLTFQLSPQVEKELGVALAAHAAGDRPLEQPPRRVH
jgi:hypothetical protein